MSRNSKYIRNITEISLLCALMCISAMIHIPLVVPITLQTLVLYFSLFAVGAKKTTIITLLYIAIGALGLPVFSGFSGGVAGLFDATGGFIVGMLAVTLVWWLLERFFPSSGGAKLLLAAVTLLLLYLLGALWYALVYLGTAEDFFASLTVTVLPFVIPDIIKIAIAYMISKRLSNVLHLS